VSESAAFRAAVSARLRTVPAWTITAAAGVVYVIAAPPSTDLAAAAYRSDLFGRAGFTLWDNSWYGGHHLPAYSLLAPALGALIGPQPLTAISTTVMVALFPVLVAGAFSDRAVRIASLWLAAGAAVGLLSNRVPFDLGLAIGLGALVLARVGGRRPPARAGALVLTLLTSLASPVAGAFLALALLAWAVAQRLPAGRDDGATSPSVAAGDPGEGPAGRRFAGAWPLALALAALLPIGALAVMFPEGGTQPFVASAFYPALAAVAFLFAVTPGRERLVRTGALLYGAAMIGAYLLPSAVGGNADRLGALFAGPVAALVLAGGERRRRQILMVAFLPLAYWQLHASVVDFVDARSAAGIGSSYYAPLLGELRALDIGYSGTPARIEVVPSRNHWEARRVAPVVPLARGWERQLETHEDPLFYDSQPLTAARYRSWLNNDAISYVALADYPLDYSARAEARLLRGEAGGAAAGEPPPYLREVWHSAHWRLFAVLGARPLAQAPGRLTAISSDSFTLSAPRAGEYQVRVHFSPYWALESGSGCVSRAPGDWTEVQARAPGELRVTIAFSLERVFDHGSRCR
jgi:hypothetical protein